MGEIVLVGINYDKRTKGHKCHIERIKMAICSPIGHQVVTKYSLSINQVILLLEALIEPLSAKQMREMLGKKDATYFRLSTIRPMITDEIIAPIDASSIRSPKQKYYLTEKGRTLLVGLKK